MEGKEREPGLRVLLELDQNDDFALRTEIVSDDGAEQGQPPNAVGPTKLPQLLAIDLDMRTHHKRMLSRPKKIEAAACRGNP